MLDTVVLCHRNVPLDVLEQVKSTLVARYGVSAATGEVSYLLWSGKGAFPDTGGTYNISIRNERYMKGEGDASPVKRECYPEVVVEASLHKAMLGHNVMGGPTCWLPSIRYLLSEIGKDTGTNLLEEAPFDEWLVRRVDVAEVFDLGSFSACRAWIRSRKDGTYPRRKITWWEDVGFMADAESTCLRAYAKGTEFDRQGKSKLLYIMDHAAVQELRRYAHRLLRIEIEIKRHYLDQEFNRLPRAVDITEQWLADTFDSEWGKFCREHEREEGSMVKTSVEVLSLLSERYGRRAADLFPAWCCMAACGENTYRTLVSRSRFYRTRRALEVLGISWHGTDIGPQFPDNPTDFIPSTNSRYRVASKHPVVQSIEDRWAS